MSDGGGFDKNVIIFIVDNKSSVHANKRRKYILILSQGPTDGLDDTTLTAEAEYSINFSEQQNKFCLNLHYNGSNRFYLFANGVKIYQLKSSDSELNTCSLHSGNISKDFTIDDMKEL